MQQLPKASIAALIASLTMAQVDPAAAAEFYQPPQGSTTTQQVRTRASPSRKENQPTCESFLRASGVPHAVQCPPLHWSIGASRRPVAP